MYYNIFFIRPTPPSTIPPSSFATQDELEDDEFEDDEFENGQVCVYSKSVLYHYGMCCL